MNNHEKTVKKCDKSGKSLPVKKMSEEDMAKLIGGHGSITFPRPRGYRQYIV